jgi:UDP-N-acetylglucosamine--N-acetylmuramyl-(pentapeptide) pyrophosphoryl-undecaprenol N-acetylglucosamine transferase
MKKNSFKIIFVGGGTGGHVLPNLAVIESLKKLSDKKNIPLELLYIGRRNAFEEKTVSAFEIKYKGIFTGKLRRYGSWRNISDIFLILLGMIQSFLILLFNRPKLIFAKGGFVTVPFCLAATILRIPFVVHESDSVVGLSNRILLPFAKKIYLGFPIENYNRLPIKKSLFTGNPIRTSIFTNKESKKIFCKKYELDDNKKIILVLGGSQGAEQINILINELVPTLIKKYVLIHVTGRTNNVIYNLEEKYERNYLTFDGIDSNAIGSFIGNADVIISRAGANSISELIALKKVAVLIPLQLAASDHQKRNAKFLQKNGVASVLDEKFLNAETLYEEIEFLMNDKKTRDSMIKNMENIFPSDSSKLIAQDLLSLLK